MDEGIPVNPATFADGETSFELIGTAGRTFSFMHAADGGTELCEAKRLVAEVDVEEIADVKGSVQNVDPPTWTPTGPHLDPFWTPFLPPFWIPIWTPLL